MNLVILGLPGAGKGTQAEKIVEAQPIPHISTGDIFRDAIQNKTPLGVEAKGYIDNGDLVPDEVTDNIVKERLAQPDTKNGFLLDGYPRTLEQAEKLDEILSGLNRKLDGVIQIDVPQGDLMERLTARYICKHCGASYHKLFNPTTVPGICDHCWGHEFYQRDDDKPETVKERLAVNVKESAPIVEYYRKHHLLHTIESNNARTPDQVFLDVLRILEALRKQK